MAEYQYDPMIMQAASLLKNAAHEMGAFFPGRTPGADTQKAFRDLCDLVAGDSPTRNMIYILAGLMQQRRLK